LSHPAQTFNFEIAGRDSLYYGKFRYMTRFYLKEASSLRGATHAEIDRTLDVRAHWRRNYDIISQEVKDNVHAAFDHLDNLPNPYKRTIFSDWVYFYTNHVEDIENLAQGPMSQRGPVTEAVITHEYGTLGRIDPKYKYRTYFTSHKPTAEQLETFRQFIRNCEDDVKVSPGFRLWLTSGRVRWIMDHHYIDHNDMKMLTMIALISPKLIRKTKPIVKINN
jgi:hypothetical protein